jgi:hypothetical protein
VRAVAFSRDSRSLAAGDDDGNVRTWDLRLATWIKRACLLANRNLSQQEWDRWIGPDLAYERSCAGLPAGEGAPADAPAARCRDQRLSISLWRLMGRGDAQPQRGTGACSATSAPGCGLCIASRVPRRRGPLARRGTRGRRRARLIGGTAQQRHEPQSHRH